MKLHDLRPADGSRQPRTRVGRGIAAGKGKTAGRGTKGQKARAGGSIPPWFEGGQTPLHMRIPKLRGFKNRFRIEYEVVNIGAIGALAERGAFETESSTTKGAKASPITVNQDILRAVGLVRTLNKPLKILGAGELSAALFVVADAFTASARAKIEAAGGSVNVLEVPSAPLAALGVTPKPGAADRPIAAKPSAKPAKASVKATAEEPAEATADEPAEASVDEPHEPAAATVADTAAAPKPAGKAATGKAGTKAADKAAAKRVNKAAADKPVAAIASDATPTVDVAPTPDADEPESPSAGVAADEPADADGSTPTSAAEPPSGDDA
jgi:large subunit ribosomal protein L15